MEAAVSAPWQAWLLPVAWCAASAGLGLTVGPVLRRCRELAEDQAIALTKDPDPVTWGKPPPQDHGGLVKTIEVYGDGRTEITSHRTGGTETIPGSCPACTTGACTWCGTYPVWDTILGRHVHRYQRCPAHTDREHQP